MAIRFDIVTLFPEIFEGFLSESLIRLAIQRDLVDVRRWNLRDWTFDRHHSVDDRPYGGGPGMVLMPEPVCRCVEEIQAKADPGLLVMLSPQGARLTQPLAEELAERERIVLMCGRYEGFDERIREELAPREISIGDYICNGGEIPAMVVMESVIRLVPGVVGDAESIKEETFSQPGWLEYPQYTRPPNFRGRKVPEILLSGNHREIAEWRAKQAQQRSQAKQQQVKG
ncbi:tRNA (guanine-N(1)-)-methyltransferase [Planctomycetes bacterium Pan216]|uniref:tRNA (guanine-N(1)-)-methyltransferase n=1 Tax=Kolteria novifilia TaxID=2527975 RepID=A0A518AXF3_9BACT|nr:tRNA (guanine-N(1)-)-methyltransferase [Planctomycetes bacterium Pan216]